MVPGDVGRRVRCIHLFKLSGEVVFLSTLVSVSLWVEMQHTFFVRLLCRRVWKVPSPAPHVRPGLFYSCPYLYYLTTSTTSYLTTSLPLIPLLPLLPHYLTTSTTSTTLLPLPLLPHTSLPLLPLLPHYLTTSLPLLPLPPHYVTTSTTSLHHYLYYLPTSPPLPPHYGDPRAVLDENRTWDLIHTPLLFL